MKAISWVAVAVVVLTFVSTAWGANVSYLEPVGGWTYLYDGDSAIAGAATSGFTSLDGTWSHDDGSDEWDGSAIGAGFGGPGGASALVDGAATYLRIQDTGDPRDYGMPDPSSRKIYFGHDISVEGASSTILNDGVTVSFRARIPTLGLLDQTHPDGGAGISPWRADGDGGVLHDGGKGMVGIRQSSGGVISFALANENEGNITTQPGRGLVMNDLNGATVSAAVDQQDGDAGTLNVLPLDPSQWHEFWALIYLDNLGDNGQSLLGGTHVVELYRDGSLTADFFGVTAGDGNDFATSYLAIGLGSTQQSGAVDVDFVAWKAGFNYPTVIPEPGTLGLAVLGVLGLVGARWWRRRG